jgi:hypothetical protein
MTQLSLFDDADFSDSRPLPLRVASAFHFSLQTCELDGGELYYAVLDWIAGVSDLTDAKDISNKWTGIKRNRRTKSESSNWQSLTSAIVKLPYTATDGKTYQRDYADAETLMVITQRLNADTKLADKLRTYLAKAGVKFDEYRANPEQMIAEGHSYLDAKAKRLGWSSDHKALRRESADARVLMTDAAKDAVAAVLTGRDYVTITNTEYRELYGRSTAELRAAMGLPQGTNLRDFQPAIALTYQQTAERIIADMLRTRAALSFDECLEIVTRVCRMIGRQIAESSGLLGIDIPTGLPLLGAAS